MCWKFLGSIDPWRYKITFFFFVNTFGWYASFVHDVKALDTDKQPYIIIFGFLMSFRLHERIHRRMNASLKWLRLIFLAL